MCLVNGVHPACMPPMLPVVPSVPYVSCSPPYTLPAQYSVWCIPPYTGTATIMLTLHPSQVVYRELWDLGNDPWELNNRWEGVRDR